MKKVFVVSGLDYRHKEHENVDSRDITQYICRVFAKLEDAEKYITDYFDKWASPEAVYEMRKTKGGFIYANLIDEDTESGTVYGEVFQLRTVDITEELGENFLYDDKHAPFCG